MTPAHHQHAMTIEPNPQRITVTCHGSLIADTKRALTLREGSLPPTQYIPRADVKMAALRRTTHSTHCPFKGDASYFTITVGKKTLENAVWTYEDPMPASAPIKDYVAFYREKMEAIEEWPATA